MRKIYSIFIILPLVIAGCGTHKNIVETIPLYRGDTISLDGHVYSLPQTVFRLNLEVVKTRTIRGPYYRFAERLLSIKIYLVGHQHLFSKKQIRNTFT